MTDVNEDRCPYVAKDSAYQRRTRDDGWRCGENVGHKTGHVLYSADGDRVLHNVIWGLPEPVEAAKEPDKRECGFMGCGHPNCSEKCTGEPQKTASEVLPKVASMWLGYLTGMHKNMHDLRGMGLSEEDERDIDSAQVFLEAAFGKLENVLTRHAKES